MHASEHSGHKDFAWAIEINRFCLGIVGLWPATDEAVKNSFVSDLRVIIVFVAVTTLSIIPFVSALLRVWGDMICMIDNLQITLSTVVVLWKLIIMRWKRTVKMMTEDWTKVKVDAERDVMVKRARTARLIMICGYCLSTITFSVGVILPYFGLSFRHITNLTDRNRLLPLQTYYFFDTDKSPQYELTYFTQVISMMMCLIIFTSVDAFLGVVIFHICGQLENLKRRLVNMVLFKEFDSVLRNNVRDHLRLIRFARNIEDMFSLLMLGLLTYLGVVLCLFGFLLLDIFKDDVSDASFSRKSFTLLGSIMLLVQTFLYCGAGELLTEQCEALHSAICDLEWYKLAPRNGRALILLMIRANDPFRITAGRIIPLTMTTFCSGLRKEHDTTF